MISGNGLSVCVIQIANDRFCRERPQLMAQHSLLSAPQPRAMLRAGAAETGITPSRPIFLFGYPHAERTSKGTHDPLLASVLYLENGSVRLLLVSVDLVFVTGELTRFRRSPLRNQENRTSPRG